MSGGSDYPAVLGQLLREKRTVLGYSLAEVTKRCEGPLSAAYLQKLERGNVGNPSPHILHDLSHALSIPYPLIMEAAGYVFPSGHLPPRIGIVVEAMLTGNDLTPEESERLAETFIRIAKAIREDSEPPS